MSGSPFLDAFRGWLSERGPSLPVLLTAFEESIHLIRLEFVGIKILEVQVRDVGTITVELVTIEGFPMATLKEISVSQVDDGTAACQHFDRWIRDELAHATAIAMTGRRGPEGAEAVLLRTDDSIDYELAVALRD
jgi:hypothetical protein